MSYLHPANRCSAKCCSYGKTTNTDFCINHWGAIHESIRKELIDTRVYTSGFPSQLSDAYTPWLNRAIEYLALKEGK